VGRFEECHRSGTRCEKLAVNFAAFWMVALIEKDLRLLGFSDRARGFRSEIRDSRFERRRPLPRSASYKSGIANMYT
jgi:hypothetical protein